MTGRLPVLAIALACAGGMAGLAVAADSATSPAGVIDSRLRTHGRMSVAWLEARSGQAAAASADEPSVIDTATAIGTMIFFR